MSREIAQKNPLFFNKRLRWCRPRQRRAGGISLVFQRTSKTIFKNFLTSLYFIVGKTISKINFPKIFFKHLFFSKVSKIIFENF